LANVEAITAPVVEFFAAPLRLVEADGSLVRAFCRF
jgi:kynurenine formamidase